MIPALPSRKSSRIAGSLRVDWRSSQYLALRLGPFQPGLDPLADHCPLELGEDTHHLEQRLARRGRGVHASLVKVQVDPEGVKLSKHAALKLMRKLLRKYAFAPERLVTDDLRSYGAAVRDLGIERRHERGRWKNNGAENSHQPTRRRERKMQRFKSPGSAQKFAAVYNTFDVQRDLTSAQTHRTLRAAAMDTWRTAIAAAQQFLSRRHFALAARQRDKASPSPR